MILLELSCIVNSKFFDADILIADPMYFIDNELHDTTIKKPQWDEYFALNQYTEEAIRENPILYEEYKISRQKYLNAYDEWARSQQSDWEICEFGVHLENLGFRNFMVFSTEYGLWSCTAYKECSLNSYGKFFSDSGYIGIFDMAEVKKYNPSFLPSKRSPRDTVYFSNFHGNIYVVNHTGKSGVDADVRIYGVGTTNFYTKQTGY